jgi:molybdopterin synthase catalytic subunit
MAVFVQTEDFDASAQVKTMVADHRHTGAGVTFTGLVRDSAQGDLVALGLEHYPQMTQKALLAIEAEAQARWSLTASLIIHRVGRLEPGDQIMMVATASAHRRDAFEAAEFLMDFLKSRAPFWKKEHKADAASWVSAQESDEAALARWSDQPASDPSDDG